MNFEVNTISLSSAAADWQNINEKNKTVEWLNEDEWMNVFHSNIQPFNHSNVIIWFWLVQIMIMIMIMIKIKIKIMKYLISLFKFNKAMREYRKVYEYTVDYFV